MVKVVSASVVWPPGAKKLVIGVLLLVVLIPVRADVTCYWCDGCDAYMPTQMKECATECSVWYSKNGETTTVNRGCLEEAELDALIAQCTSALCNTASVTRCVRCDSPVSAECETVICPTAQDKCYLNPADGHRGCKLDQAYETDCAAGTGTSSCIECTSQPGKPCNDIPKCVACDIGNDPECLEDTRFVQQCPRTTDQCYRYRDAEQVVHLGCTGAEDYTSACQGTANCHTCSGEECNRNAKFECYTCDDCGSVEVDQALAECSIFEENQCYVGYDKTTKQTHRSCFSGTVPLYDFFKLCDSTGCNDRSFPEHLQCYQCVDCTEVTVEDANYCSSTEATGCFMLQLSSGTLVRGCNTDEAFADCQLDRNCHTCGSDQCNREPAQKQTYCNQCTGVTACEQPIPSTACTDSSFTNQCYLYSDGTDQMRKGCVLDLDPAMADVCYDQTDPRCTLCKDNQCNQQHCVRCDSGTDGMVCVVADKAAVALQYKLCAGAVCRVEIDAEGHTVRGCLEDFENPVCEPGSCVETVERGSNAGVFPADRRQCYKCAGDSCWAPAEESDGEYCLLYRGAEDGCYIYNDGSTIVRGCTTDPDARCAGDDSDPDEACTVSLTDLSNDAAQSQTPMTCYADCPGNMPPCLTVTCPRPSDRCFVSVSLSGVITRGCTPTSCPADSKDCFTCNEPICNGVYSVCSTCDTAFDTGCAVGLRQSGAICEQSTGCFQYRDEDRAVYGCAEQASPLCVDNEERCQFCEEPLCNAKDLNLCYTCTDCPDALTPGGAMLKLCAEEGDHCITGLYDGRIDRGCQSGLAHPIDEYSVIEDCTAEPGCNQLLITEYVSCYACVDCPDGANEADATLCLNPPTNQCYTKRESNGTISRGCANEDALIGCDNGINCVVCEQSNCNSKAVPREFSCVQCPRSEACADRNVLSDCPNTLGMVFDACVIHRLGSEVTKGCLSSPSLFALCYGNTNDDRCTVTYESQGNAHPVQCIDCRGGVDCVRGDPDELPTDTAFHGSCVSFVDANGMVVRGNVINYPECQDSSHCAECFSDVCNGGLFPDDRLLCYQCSGEPCARLPLTAITPEPCLRYDAANEKCYTWYESASSAQRGCALDDAVCQTEAVLCQECADSGCNVLGYDAFDDTKVCVQCSSNRACDESPSEETCSDGGGCYTFFLSELLVTAKGCVSELREGMAWYEECVGGESGRCERCYGDYCNRNRCYVCNSLSGDGGNCIEPGVGSTAFATCPESDECVAFIDAGGHTIRGCSDSFEQECSATGGTCVNCSGDYCNGGPVPGDRLKCYQCAGTPDCLNPTKSSERYCDIYREGEDSCYTLFQDETTVERGCTLQRSEPCDQQPPCVQCNTTGCNNQRALVQSTLSCAQCAGDACPAIDEPANDALVKACPSEILLGRTDRCYAYFHPNGTTERGCLSELAKRDDTLAAQCFDPSDVSCKVCPSDGCNARSVRCFVCDTDTFPSCADELDEAAHSSLVQACATGQCVSVLDGAVTRKGCAEDYTVECASTGSMCETFEGAMSNGAIYPLDRLRCFQCQGSSSCDAIQSSSASASACQQYSAADECYTYVSDSGETFRGCASDPPVSNPCTEQPDLCIRCSSASACNDQPAVRSNELICAQCTRAAECETMERFERCTQPVLLGRSDSCYVQSFAGEILARGCLSDAAVPLRDKCADAGAPNSECSLCLCDRCNGPTVQCVACESETGCGSVLGAEATLVPCRTGSCVSFVKQLATGSSLIVKGCSEAYEQDTCGSGQSAEGSYQLCHTAGCNDVMFPVGRLKCYQCEGEACSDASLQPTICEPYREGDRCYSFRDRQQKGCLGQLDNVTECSEGGQRCTVCDSSDGCNEEPRALQCIACSSRSDPRCADPMAAVLSMKMCLVGGCVTLIDDDGYTVRGCATEYDASSESCTAAEATATCHVCTAGDACNNALLPANRLKCYQCSGAACLDVSQQQPSVCQRYSATEACYAYATSSTNIRRGCLSDASFQCPDEGCVTCTAGDGCNDDPPIVPNALTCHHCDGPDCAMQQTAGKGTACPDVLLGRTDACYAFVERYTVRRGCLSEAATACDPTDENCHVCTGESDCNGAQYSIARHECVLCDEGTAGERCKWGFDYSEAQRCTTTSGPASYDAGCYTCYSSSVGSFQRGCVGENRQAQCQPSTVQVCLGTACNRRNEQLQICAKCEAGCETDRWTVEECRGVVPYERRGCYIMLDSRKRIVARGCAADLNEDTWNLCSNVKDSSCVTCLGNECNHAGRGLSRLSLLCTLLIALLFTISNRG